ncbi:hypothetical protein [Bacteroides sp.]|uniref:hypothetical protein n=1 Tax=Bacteroides sp. TaxID=29523 RepID=UPI0026195F6A|nr:hypothetical protein [Bacteroides sp.]MDD3040465.1 hypothetical protein [Bacteroides sp.]
MAASSLMDASPKSSLSVQCRSAYGWGWSIIGVQIADIIASTKAFTANYGNGRVCMCASYEMRMTLT